VSVSDRLSGAALRPVVLHAGTGRVLREACGIVRIQEGAGAGPERVTAHGQRGPQGRDGGGEGAGDWGQFVGKLRELLPVALADFGWIKFQEGLAGQNPPDFFVRRRRVFGRAAGS